MGGITEYFLPDELERVDSVERRRASLAIRAVFMALVWAPIVGILYWMAGSQDAVIVLSVGSGAAALTPFLLKWTRRMDVAGTYLLVTVTAMLVGLCFLFGGIESPSLTWILLVPVFAVLFQGIRQGAIWLAIVMLCWAGIAALDFTGYPFESQLDPAMYGWLRFVEATGLACIVFAAFFLQDRLQSWLIDTARARESETNLVLETAPDGILTVDPDGVIQSTNDAAAEVFDRRPDEIIGHHVHDLISSLEPEDLSERGGADREHTGIRDDGSIFPVEVAYGLFDGETREGAVLVFRDITERKAAEHELREARDQAVEASRTKSEFLANMSHELRTPLNAVIGYSEMLIDELEAPVGFGSPSEEFVERHLPDLKRIRTAGKHLLALINDILDLSKIEAGKMTTHVELIEIREVLDSVIGTIRPLADKNGNTLELKIGDGIQFMRSDVTKLRQILFNLLSNACKFTRDGTVRLEVSRSDEGDHIVFKVADDGIGMSPAQVEQVFEAFTQADSSTTRKFGGTGLGLTITNHFTSLLGGDIDVESVEGEGTTFTVRLDADLDGAGEAQPMAGVEGGQSLGAEHSFVEPTVLSDDVVLVIDDDPTMRDLLQRVLERDGFQVATAASGSEGLVLAEQLRPSAITLDVMMPSMDGWTLLSKLKEHPELKDIPVVMITMVSETARGYALGADDFLVKPVDRRQLVDIMERYRRQWDGDRGELLLVEDDEPTRALVRRTLQKDGWAVTEAENGRVGLEKLESLEPDLVVLDLMMPTMDGFEFLQELRSDPRCADVPVVVVTAKDLSPSEEANLRAGVSEILIKGGSEQSRLLEEVRSQVLKVATTSSVEREVSSG